MGGNSLFIGKFLGIPVRVHTSWLLVFVLVTASLAGAYFPQSFPGQSPALYWGLGIVTSVFFFASVLLHELAHSVVAQQRGLPVRDIVLFVFGGVSELSQEPENPTTEFVMAIVGPLTSIVLGGIFLLLWQLLQLASHPLGSMLMYVGGINLSLGVFNLIPGFPLDGGRVLRSLLWWHSRSLERATLWASRVGQFVAYAFIAIGILEVFAGGLVNGIWLIFIGWFLDNAAISSYRQVAVQSLLAGHTVGEVMGRGCSGIPANTPLSQVAEHYFLAEGRRCLPVMEDGVFVGLLTIHGMKEFRREEWGHRAAREAMIPRSRLRTTHPSAGLAEALQQMAEDGVNQLPVLQDGEIVGLLTRENIATFLKLKAELGA